MPAQTLVDGVEITALTGSAELTDRVIVSEETVWEVTHCRLEVKMQ